MPLSMMVRRKKSSWMLQMLEADTKLQWFGQNVFSVRWVIKTLKTASAWPAIYFTFSFCFFVFCFCNMNSWKPNGTEEKPTINHTSIIWEIFKCWVFKRHSTCYNIRRRNYIFFRVPMLILWHVYYLFKYRALKKFLL